MVDYDEIANNSLASIEKEDLKILLPIVAKIEPKNIFELGMHQGYSMEIWRKAFNPVHLTGIEKDPSTPESYINEAGMLWNTDSHLVDIGILNYDRKQYDFLFIDGDHTYEGVKQDFFMYSKLIRKGGIVALHDCCHHAEGVEVYKFWEELKSYLPYVEIKTTANSTGMGVVWL